MARINIEEAWWSDARRQKLVRLFKGDARLADGLMIAAWRMAQNYTDRKFLIPLDEFLCLEDAEFLFECALADICMASHENPRLLQADSKQCLEDLGARKSKHKDYLVYLRGSEKYLGWVGEQRQKARLGGRKSAQRPRDNLGRLLPKVQAESKVRLDNLPSLTNPIQVSDSGSGSGSGSGSLSGSSSRITILGETPADRRGDHVKQTNSRKSLGFRMKYPEAFEALWIAYGKRGDKRKAFIVWKESKFNEEETRELMEKAVPHYVQATRDIQFRKHLDGFLESDWRQWVNPPSQELGNGHRPMTDTQRRNEEWYKRAMAKAELADKEREEKDASN